MIEICGKTDVGRRELNEDRFVADAPRGLALVADGMGGAEAGEVAAEVVSAHIAAALGRGVDLQQAVVSAHAAVQSAAGNGRGKPGMGATLVAACFQGYGFHIAWVGDSRAYLWTGGGCGGELWQLTRDHSRVEQLLANGNITLDEVALRRDRHLITRAMGVGVLGIADVPSLRGTLCRGQQLLLCSDGLNDAVSGAEIALVMEQPVDAREKLDELIGRALFAGGRDNITAVIVTPDEAAPAPDSAVPLTPVSVVRADGDAEYFMP